MPWTEEDEKKWQEAQKKVEARDRRAEDLDREVHTLDNPDITQAEYKKTAGETARLAEKDFYNKLAKSDYMKEVMADMNKLVDDPAQNISDDTRTNIAELNGRLSTMWESWKNYTGSFTRINNSMVDAEKEEEYGKKFLEDLNECITLFEKDDFALLKTSIADTPAMKSCYTTLKHLEGHYEEMTTGSLRLHPGVTILDYTKQEPEANDNELKERIKKMAQARGYDEARIEFMPYDGPLFPHEPSPNDVRQGNIGDCYFVASLASIAAENGKMIRDRMKDDGQGHVYIAMNDRTKVTDKNGKQVEQSELFYIKVNKTVPVIRYYKKDAKGELQPVAREDAFAKNSPWTQFAEKGYAASGFHLADSGIYEDQGGYYDLPSGHEEQSMKALFGAENVKVQSIRNDSKDWDNVFEKVKEALNNHKLVTAGSNRQLLEKGVNKKQLDKAAKERLLANDDFNNLPNKKAKQAAYEKTKKVLAKEVFNGVLLANHAYSVTGAISGENGDFIVVRNPHANVDFDGTKLIKNGVVNLNENEIPNGYSVVPKDKINDWFDEVTISDVLRGKTHVDPGEDVRQLSNAIFTGLKDSRSFRAKLSMSNASQDFRDFYESAQRVKDLARSPICCAKTLDDAMKDMKEKASKYYNARENSANDFDERNMRCTLAKAAIGMADAYAKNDHKNLKSDIREVTENIVKERLAYVVAKNNKTLKDVDVKTLQNGAGVIMGRLSNDKILKMALNTSVNKLPKALNDAKAAVKKQDKIDAELRAKDEAALKEMLKPGKAKEPVKAAKDAVKAKEPGKAAKDAVKAKEPVKK